MSERTRRVINNPTGPVNTGTGNQYNHGDVPDPINTGPGRQFHAEGPPPVSPRSSGGGQRRREAGPTTNHTTIIGGNGPVNTGDGAQFCRQRPDGTWETYTPGDS